MQLNRTTLIELWLFKGELLSLYEFVFLSGFPRARFIFFFQENFDRDAKRENICFLQHNSHEIMAIWVQSPTVSE